MNKSKPCEFDYTAAGEKLAELCGENEVNKRLIEAAPDLLDACRFALSVQKSQGVFDVSEKLNVEKLEAAIANATGCGDPVDLEDMRRFQEQVRDAFRTKRRLK